LENGQVLDKI